MTAQPMIKPTPHSEKEAANPPAQDAAAVPETANDNPAPAAVTDATPTPEAAPTADAVDDATSINQIAAATEEAAPTPDAVVEKAATETPAATEATLAEAILLPPSTQLPKPKQATGETMPVHDARVGNLILLPAVLTGAEKNLATHIGSLIDPTLEKNLLLSVSNNLEKGTTSLILSFEGDMVAANPAVLSEQVVAALHKASAIQTLFAQHHHAPVSSVHDGKLQVMIPHLTTAQYAHLMQSLAAGIEASPLVAEHAPAPTHPAAEIAAEMQANAAAAMAGHPPANEVGGVNHLGVANQNERAPTQTAMER